MGSVCMVGQPDKVWDLEFEIKGYVAYNKNMLNHLYPLHCKKLVFPLVFLISMFAAAPGWSQTFPEKPPDKDFFVDQARLIKPDEAAQINQIAAKLLAEERIPIFVVTLSSLAARPWN